MGEVVIKALNSIYHVYGKTNDFSLFLKCLNEKLKVCSRLSCGQFSAFFNLDTNLRDDQILDIYQVCANNSTIILGFEIEKMQRNIKVISNLYAGCDYFFDEDIIVSSSIAADVYVKTTGNIYVVGHVSGKIDLINKLASCTCSSAKEAKIRICDSQFQNVTNLSTCRMYYNNRSVVIE